MLSTDSKGARVLLESGAAHFDVHHRRWGETHWALEAGPYQIRGVGTEFLVSWEPGAQAFALSLSQGVVEVSGGCLTEPRRVSAGAALQLSCGRMPDPLPPASSPAASRLSPPVASAVGTGSAEGGPPAPHARGAGTERTDGWRKRLADGDLSEALGAAELAGFDAVIRDASLAELQRLADAARLTRKSDRAVEILLALCRRFPWAPAAATAAFTLGRIAFEGRQSFDDATHWFSVYLEEAPHGPLMGDALGRLMETRIKQGDRATAQADAACFLQRFPRGPCASQARSILAD